MNWQIIALSVLATGGLVIMWRSFWQECGQAKANIPDILLSPAFFRTVTVMGIIAATVVLSLADHLKGEVTGAILSGIVGYVLGNTSNTK